MSLDSIGATAIGGCAPRLTSPCALSDTLTQGLIYLNEISKLWLTVNLLVKLEAAEKI